jgi:solute carrier family 25 (peroxisomal adenine nucleotide transporter), member 17
MLSMLLRILKEEGVAGWYSGFAATMLNTFSMRALSFLTSSLASANLAVEYAYFFFYSFVRNAHIKRLTAKIPPGSKVPPLSTAAELFIGAVAGALAQIFTIPVSVIATRQQVGRSSSPSEGDISSKKLSDAYDDSFLGVAREIVREEGVTGLWLGIKPGLVLTVNPAITYGVFERLKNLILMAKTGAGSNTKLTPGLSFLVGAFSKTLATIVCWDHHCCHTFHLLICRYR